MDGQGSRKTWPPCLWVTTLLKLGKSVLPNSSQTRENMVSVALSVHMIRWLLIPEYLNSSGTSRRQAQDRSDSSPGDSMFWDVDEIKKKKKKTRWISWEGIPKGSALYPSQCPKPSPLCGYISSLFFFVCSIAFYKFTYEISISSFSLHQRKKGEKVSPPVQKENY